MRHKIFKAIATLPVSHRFYSSPFLHTNIALLHKITTLSSTFHSKSSSFNMTSTGTVATNDASIFTYEDKDAFSSLNHPGYSSQSDAENFSGGWLAHRVAAEDQDSCWVKEISSKLTVSLGSLPKKTKVETTQ